MSVASVPAENQEVEINTIMSTHSMTSSEDPPMEEWSSLIISVLEANKKRELYRRGLYDPGSGELCAKYIPLSDSSIYRHPYYRYPAVVNPGIEEALLDPVELESYPSDGQQRYIDLCAEMNEHVVTMFHRGLLEEVIDLSYYCVSSQGVRAMSMALYYNNNVKSFHLTDNFINADACFHLGEMLKFNETLYELNLSGCRIGPEGLRHILPGLEKNKTLHILNLNRCALTDIGGRYLAQAIGGSFPVKQLYLKYNSLGSITAAELSNTFEYSNSLTHIDLSWNYFFSLVGTLSMLNLLADNTKLEELDLSWNSLAGLKFANAIQKVMCAPNLTVIKLNNNNFQNDDIDLLVQNMTKAKKLRLFSLSNNPLTVKDAIKVIEKMRLVACKIQRLELDNIKVNYKFLDILQRINKMKSKKNVVITHGDVERTKDIPIPDQRTIVFRRLQYLTEIKPKKKNRVDVPLFILELERDGFEQIEMKDFANKLHHIGAVVDKDLIENLVYAFPGIITKKALNINVILLADYVRRMCPERRLPPAPPTSLLPPPPPPPPPRGKPKK